MTRKELVEGILRTSGITKANVERFYQGLVELALNKLAREGEFVLPGLGVLRVRTRKARMGRNPRTGEKISIPRRKVVRFTPYKELKEALNPPAGGTAGGSEAERP